MMRNKRLKLGIVSSLLITGILALAVIFNVLIEKLNVSWDLSQEQIYTISDQTKSIVSGLEEDITIYVLDSEEGFPVGYRQMLQQYQKNSKHILIRYRDLELYPNFPYEYVSSSTETITKDSLIVVRGEKSVYLNADKFSDYTLSEDYSSYNTSIEFEPLLTSAINVVNDGETSVIYETTGHEEHSLSSSIQTGLMRDNYSLQDLSLIQENIPEDADIILINAPSIDFSEEDCEKLRTYLENGGSVCYVMNYEKTLEHLEALLEDYGIDVAEGIVLEQDYTMIYNSIPSYILPIIEDTELTKDLYNADVPLLVPVAKGLTEKAGSGCTVTGLLQTSDYSYSKINLNSEYISRESEDIVGPFELAMLSEREGKGTLLVLGSSYMLDEEVDEVVSGSNQDFFLNGFNYLLGDTDKISIRGKGIRYDYNVYSDLQVYLICGMAIIGIPLLILIAGIVVVATRKRRSQIGGKRQEEAEESVNEEQSAEISEKEAETEESDTGSVGETNR